MGEYEFALKNILVAVDLDLTDPFLLNPAIALAQKFRSKLWIIHVAAPDPGFIGYRVGPSYIRESRADELRKEHVALQDMMKRAKDLSIEAEALLIQGPTVEMLELEIEKLQIDLLVMGSRRHGFLYNAFVGHTSVKLMKDQLIPIMLIPLPDEA